MHSKEHMTRNLLYPYLADGYMGGREAGAGCTDKCGHARLSRPRGREKGSMYVGSTYYYVLPAARRIQRSNHCRST